MKQEDAFKEFSKIKSSLNPDAASHNNASWDTDSDGFLEHSLSGESLYYKGPTLQKVIPGSFVSFLIVL